MAARRTIDLLPQIFRTSTNRRFLNATLDQMIQEPVMTRMASYVGRAAGSSTYSPGDPYLKEGDDFAQNYQLEPSLIVRKRSNNVDKEFKIDNVYNYLDMLNKIGSDGGINNDNDALFSQEYYNYQGFIDLEKMINYSQYYWVSGGPDVVEVNAGGLPVEETFNVHIKGVDQSVPGYTEQVTGAFGHIVSGFNNDINPTITLVRGGNYIFSVNQLNHPFWIQSEAGDDNNSYSNVSWQQNLSRREVFGVVNNGSSVGQILFKVPKKTDQDEFVNMNKGEPVDIVIDTPYNQIQNNPISLIIERLGGIDGITTSDTVKRVIFTDTSEDNWVDPGNYDGDFDSLGFDAGDYVPTNQRKGIWQLKVENGVVRCTYLTDWVSNQKLFVKEGRTYGNRWVYKDSTATIRLVPVITATLDTLYYQTSQYGFGIIKLVDPIGSSVLNVNDIVGQKNYTSPNGVRFTSGLKVKFTQLIEPAEYKDQEYIVEGVGIGIRLVKWNNLVTPEIYTRSIGSGYDADSEPYDTTNFNSTLNAPIDKDYILINRSSRDGNPWSRGNRWFHKDVLSYTASILTPGIGYPFDETQRAKRPILEFIPDLKLYNGGTNFLSPVGLIDVNTTDALSLVEGQDFYAVDGTILSNGTTIIFAADTDADVRNTIYTVQLANVDALGDFQIHLLPKSKAQAGDTIVVTSGTTRQGSYYQYDGSHWVLSQQKLGTNTEPLFDILKNGLSIGDQNLYPSSNFTGSKLLSYKRNTATTTDVELGFGISYRSIGNIGDILFSNDFDVDDFGYSVDNVSYQLPINIGNPVIINEDRSFTSRNPWSKVGDRSKQLVVKNFTASLNQANDFMIPIEFITSKNERNIFVRVNDVETKDFQIFTNSDNNSTFVRFPNDLAVNDTVNVKIYGRTAETKPVFTVPKNLERNSFNDTFSSVTLGQLRDHLIEMSSNNIMFAGEPTGNNNLRDIDYLQSAGTILQHSAPFHIAQMMFNNSSTDIIQSIDYSRREYARFKETLFDLLENTQFEDVNDSRAVLDKVLQIIMDGANVTLPFYYTDMIVTGKNFTKTTYSVFNPADKKYNALRNYDFTDAAQFYNSILVYLNGEQLVNRRDYLISGRVVTLTDYITLAQDDIIDIYEYDSSKGCRVPATPSKLGIYPSYVPEIYHDTTVMDPKLDSPLVIQGHDGSLTLAFGDFRDQAILEFEKRVYNNIHIDWLSDNTLAYHQTVEPSAFRKTDYDLAEWTQLLSTGFLEWAGRNGVDIFSNTITSNDPFSYNYSQATDVLFGDLMPGYWRGVYRYFYETDRPHTHPWEIAGYPVKPVWWENKYGPAPYTSGNLVLWGDLEEGVYYTDEDGSGAYVTRNVDPLYVKTGLSQIIPVDEHGNLLPPISVVVKKFDSLTSSTDWRFGDQGPVESAWRRSSDYPFTVMTAYALAKPAEFCSFTFNLLEYKRDADLDQVVNVVTNNRKTGVKITGDEGQYVGTNIWIRDRLVSIGQDIETNFRYLFEDSTLNLAYKMSGYTDKKYLQILAEQSSPNSKNTGVLIPDENYDIVLTKSAPTSHDIYSAVIVEKVDQGYAVYGFDNNRPYFSIIPSIIDNDNYIITVGNASATIYHNGQDSLLVVPYGTIFNTRQQVADFLISYGRYLTVKGFQFLEILEDTVTVKDWTLSVKEFLFFSQQGWDNQTVISLTPAGNLIKFDNGIASVEDLSNSFSGTRMVDSENQVVNKRDYRVYREGTAFEIQLNDPYRGIHLLDLHTHQYEHTLVFDNTTVFNDVIYQPEIGNRQQRLKIVGRKTAGWNGSLYAPGFLINHKPVEEWVAYQDYYKGEIITFKGKYFHAKEFIPGKDRFVQEEWVSDHDILATKKLIPNPTFNAAQFEKFYDIDTQDVNSSADIQGRHATGYQPRKYLSDISLDAVSQHKFYLGMIAEKGTKAVINKFLRASLPYLDNDITINEEWAVREGTYGNIENRDAIEIPLKTVTSVNDSVVIELLNKNDARDLRWNTFKSKDLLYVPVVYDKHLFTKTDGVKDLIAKSGPVLLEEINATVYDVNKLENIGPLATNMGEGSVVWVAADIDDDWNIYRASNDYGMYVRYVEPVSDIEIKFTTGRAHGLKARDKVMIKGPVNTNATSAGGTITSSVSGVYRVISATAKTFNVIRAENNTGTIVAGATRALLFKLQGVRYDARTDFAEDTPYRGWITGDTIYVDDVQGKWQVLTNQTAWTYREDHSPLSVTSTDNFGQSSAISSDQNTFVISSTEGNGTLYAYGRDNFDNWVEIQSITSPDLGAQDFGKNLAYNDMNYIISGAPNTIGVYRMTYSPSMGNAPNGSNKDFAIADFAQDYTISASDMTVSINGVETTAFTIITLVNTKYVRFNTAPASNSTVILDYNRQAGAVYILENVTDNIKFSQIIFDDVFTTGSEFGAAVATSKDGKWLYVSALGDETVEVYQLQEVQTLVNSYTGDGSTTDFVMPLPARLLPATPNQIKVYLSGDIQVPYADYIVDNTGVYVRFAKAPADGSEINVEYSSYYDYVDTIINPSAGNSFGNSLSTSTDGRQIVIGAKDEAATKDGKSYSSVGGVYVYTRSIENFISDGISTTYSPYFYTSQTYTDQVRHLRVFVDDVETNEYSVSSIIGLDGSTIVGIDVTFNTVPDPSAIIRIETNSLDLNASIASPEVQENMHYGSSVLMCPNNCSIYIGAPDYKTKTTDVGKVYRNVNIAKAYGDITGTVVDPTVTIDDAIRLNGFQVVFSGTTLASVVDDINNSNIPGVFAENVDNKLKIYTDSQLTFNKLVIGNDYGTGLEDLGLDLYPGVQGVEPVYQEDGYKFGESLAISPDASKLIVATSRGSSYVELSLDTNQTTFDGGATIFRDKKYRSGNVYLYEYQNSATETSNDVGKFAYATKFVIDNIKDKDAFGTSVTITDNWVMVGSPHGTRMGVEKGLFYAFYNPTARSVWHVIREQTPSADSNKLQRAIIYNDATNQIVAELPVIDSSIGKTIPFTVEGIDYVANYDPASYNVTPTAFNVNADRKNVWGPDQVGKLWWDTNALKYLDHEQSDLLQRSAYRDQLFPDSKITVYQWVESTVPPLQYNEVMRDTGMKALYTVNEVYSQITVTDINTNLSTTRYYFWATSIMSTESTANVDLNNYTQALTNPRNTNIPYISLLSPNALALYNCKDLIGGDYVLRIEYNKNDTVLPVHEQWSIYADNSRLGMSNYIYNKLTDSIATQDAQGRQVPDITINEKQRYGFDVRPRQTVFSDYQAARKFFWVFANDFFGTYPIRLIRSIESFQDHDPLPDQTQYYESVENDVELGYLNTDYYINKTILTKNDGSIGGGWSLRTWNTTEWRVDRVQTYDLRNYWTFDDWYAEGYSADTIPTYYVDFNVDIADLELRNNDVIKILNSSGGGFQLVQVIGDRLELVGQENATLRLLPNIFDPIIANQGLDGIAFENIGFARDNNIEMRKIFDAIVQMLNNSTGVFVKEFRKLGRALFDQGLTLIANQFTHTDWLMKTSFISIEHTIRNLNQIPYYIKQPETVVEDYVKEVKPYHTKIRKYTSIYPGLDDADMFSTDFDLPPYLTIDGYYRSPQLENPIDSDQFTIYPDKAWLDNYTYKLDVIDIIDGGTNYTNDTVLTITGTIDAKGNIRGSGAKARVKVSAGGVITQVLIDSPGEGFISAPEIRIEGTGSGALLIARIKNEKVRTIKNTLTFDRYTYVQSLMDWQPYTDYYPEDLFYYNHTPYRVTEYFTSTDKVDLTYVLAYKLYRWEPRTRYRKGDIVITDWANNEAYEVMTDHTSGSSLVYEIDKIKYESFIGDGVTTSFKLILGIDISKVFVDDVYMLTDAEYSIEVLEASYNIVFVVPPAEGSLIRIYNNSSTMTPFYGAILDNAADRIWSYYKSAPGQAGRDLTQLMAGIEYPGVKVIGTSFDYAPGFDMNRYDIGLFDSQPVSSETDTSNIDTIYYSEFRDSNLGLRPEDIITDGDGFVSTYSSHAPEELVPGRIFDALDIKVTTVVGSEMSGEPAGPDVKVIGTTANSDTRFPFSNDVVGGVEKLIVYTKETGFKREGIDFTIDYLTNEIEFSVPFGNPNDVVYVLTLGATGEKMLPSVNYIGDGSTTLYSVTDLRKSVVGQIYAKIDSTEIFDFDITWNENVIFPWTSETFYSQVDLLSYGGKVYRPIEDFTSGPTFDATLVSEYDYEIYVKFNNPPLDNAFIQIRAFNEDAVRKAYSAVKEVTYTVPAGAVTYPDSYVFDLPETMQYDGPWDAFLTVRLNGLELCPANNTYYTGDGSTSNFVMPLIGSTTALTISDSDIVVILEGVKKTINIDYTIFNDGSSDPTVQFNDAPALGSQIIISDSSIADFKVEENTVRIKEKLTITNDYTNLVQDDRITIVQYSNHDMYDMRTQVFKGSKSTTGLVGGIDGGGWDSFGFDVDSIVVISNPVYEFTRPVTQNTFLQVFLNGVPVSPVEGYKIENNTRLVMSPSYNIVATDVVFIRHFSETVTKPTIKFRIFKDMLDNTEYRGIGYYHSTTLTRDLAITDTVIHVADASKLATPGISKNQPGVIFVNGERITYWVKNDVTNTLSQIRRATGGTGAAYHVSGSVAEDGGEGMAVPGTSIQTSTSDLFLGDGSTASYMLSQSGDNKTVLVRVDGIRLQPIVDFSIVEDMITFPSPPTVGQSILVEILAENDVIWYETVSGGQVGHDGSTLVVKTNGSGLQYTNTVQANYLRAISR